MGCYRDCAGTEGSGRAVGGPFHSANNHAACYDLAAQGLYSLFALQRRGETSACFVGDSLSDAEQLGNSSSCSAYCDESGLGCGGVCANSLFQLTHPARPVVPYRVEITLPLGNGTAPLLSVAEVRFYRYGEQINPSFFQFVGSSYSRPATGLWGLAQYANDGDDGTYFVSDVNATLFDRGPRLTITTNGSNAYDTVCVTSLFASNGSAVLTSYASNSTNHFELFEAVVPSGLPSYSALCHPGTSGCSVTTLPLWLTMPLRT